MKRRKTLVRAVAFFMVGLITALALIVPTSAIMTEYPTLENNTTYDCVMPFNVNFIGTDGTLDYAYSVPVGYNSPTEQTGIQGHDTLMGRVLGGDGITTNYATLEYYYYPTEWRNVNEDGWGGVPIKLRIDNTELDGKTIVIEAPTFYVNPLTSNWYYASDPTTYNKWAMGAFRMPTLEDPTIQAYVGRYSVLANVVDDVGTKHPVSYSRTFDTRVNNNWIPMLEPSIFQEYVINDIQETGYNRIVAVTDFKAYVDYDYYEYVEPEPEAQHITIRISNRYDATFPIPTGATQWADMNNVYCDNGYDWRIYVNSYGMMYLADDDIMTPHVGEITYMDGQPVMSTENISTNPIFKSSPVHNGGSNDDEVGDGFDWVDVYDEEPPLDYDVLPVDDDASTASNMTTGTWELVVGSPLKATGIDVSYPVYERDFEVDDINLAYPDFTRYISNFRGIGNIDVNADFTGWIANATSGFLNFELLPNFSIGGVLAILVGFSLVILFLKIFAGG